MGCSEATVRQFSPWGRYSIDYRDFALSFRSTFVFLITFLWCVSAVMISTVSLLKRARRFDTLNEEYDDRLVFPRTLLLIKDLNIIWTFRRTK